MCRQLRIIRFDQGSEVNKAPLGICN
jgi:hypothetical protein